MIKEASSEDVGGFIEKDERHYRVVRRENLDFSSSPTFRKNYRLLPSKLRIVTSRELVTTSVGGDMETQCIASIGDVVIMGAQSEEYVMSAEKFHRTYYWDEGEMAWISTTKVAAQILPEDSTLLVRWTPTSIPTWQFAKTGDYIVQRLDDTHDVYFINQDVFLETFIPL